MNRIHRTRHRPAAALLLVCALMATRAEAARDFLIPARVRPSPLEEQTADGRPTAAGIELLRAHARGRLVRVWKAGAVLEGGNARFDSLGIHWSAESAASGVTSRSLAWAEVDRLETLRSNVPRGALLGALAGALAMAVVGGKAGSDPGPGIVVVFVLPPAGAVLGGLVGAGIPRWQREWPPAGRPPRTDR